MPHGVTNKMRNIRGPIPASRVLNLKTRIIAGHTESNREQRRHPLWYGGRRGDGVSRTYYEHNQMPGLNTPYVNLARDNKPTRRRRLRAELRDN